MTSMKTAVRKYKKEIRKAEKLSCINNLKNITRVIELDNDTFIESNFDKDTREFIKEERSRIIFQNDFRKIVQKIITTKSEAVVQKIVSEKGKLYADVYDHLDNFLKKIPISNMLRINLSNSENINESYNLSFQTPSIVVVQRETINYIERSFYNCSSFGADSEIVEYIEKDPKNIVELVEVYGDFLKITKDSTFLDLDSIGDKEIIGFIMDLDLTTLDPRFKTNSIDELEEESHIICENEIISVTTNGKLHMKKTDINKYEISILQKSVNGYVLIRQINAEKLPGNLIHYELKDVAIQDSLISNVWICTDSCSRFSINSEQDGTIKHVTLVKKDFNLKISKLTGYEDIEYRIIYGDNKCRIDFNVSKDQVEDNYLEKFKYKYKDLIK